MHDYITQDHRAVKWPSEIYSSHLAETLYPLFSVSLSYPPSLLTPSSPKPMVTAFHCSVRLGLEAFTYACDHTVFVFSCLGDSTGVSSSGPLLSPPLLAFLPLSSKLSSKIYVSFFSRHLKESQRSIVIWLQFKKFHPVVIIVEPYSIGFKSQLWLGIYGNDIFNNELRTNS